jgi:competence protein ComEA
MTLMLSRLSRRLVPLAAVAMLIAAMGGTWTRIADAAPGGSPPARAASPPSTAVVTPSRDELDDPRPRKAKKEVAGKLNLNTATEDQLMQLPTVGPAKAERIVEWRKKNGGFKRVADLRRVKGFGYKTFKKLEPFLDIKGETTLAER